MRFVWIEKHTTQNVENMKVGIQRIGARPQSLVDDVGGQLPEKCPVWVFIRGQNLKQIKLGTRNYLTFGFQN